MSELKVLTVAIDDILVHPNAERLDIAVIKGWNCIVGKEQFKKGDKGVYIPIDSIITEDLEKKIFGPDPKIKLEKRRVKTIKIRGAISQGLLVDYQTVGIPEKVPVDTDVTVLLGVTKYEPPAPAFQQFKGRQATKKEVNPNFHKYTSIENYKNYTTLFQPDDKVVITEKIHGTNFRAGWVPFVPTTFWDKVKVFFKMAPEWQFVFGSHNVQLQHKMLNDTFYDTNVYAEAVKKYHLQELLEKGEVVYGEIYGGGIQNGYDYGLKDQRKLIVFDIKKGNNYLDFQDFYARSIAFYHHNGHEVPDAAPVLYIGRFADADLKNLIEGPSVLSTEQKVREGCVIKALNEVNSPIGRKILKAINPEYLLRNQSDFH